jgi:hypothetical protein
MYEFFGMFAYKLFVVKTGISVFGKNKTGSFNNVSLLIIQSEGSIHKNTGLTFTRDEVKSLPCRIDQHTGITLT